MGMNSEAVTAIQKKEMINALEEHFGNVTAAAKAIKITPRTHYRWLKEDREYAEASENMKDVTFRRVKDRLLEKALKMIDKGDSAVLNRMMGIYFKNVPQEMLVASRYNNVPIRATIRYVDTREEAMQLLKDRGEASE
jgi:transposase-like protein